MFRYKRREIFSYKGIEICFVTRGERYVSLQVERDVSLQGEKDVSVQVEIDVSLQGERDVSLQEERDMFRCKGERCVLKRAVRYFVTRGEICFFTR